MEFTCEQIGLDQTELQERIIESIAERMLNKYVTYSDEDGDVSDIENTKMRRKLDRAIMERIDAEVERVANAYLEPITADVINNYTLQQTNQWGEAKGDPMTFTEYLADRAAKYMEEPVDFNGRTKKESLSSSFRASSTRMVYAIEKHLHYHIQEAMKKAIGESQKTLNSAILDTVKASLAEVSSKIKTTVTVK